jgi:hypothetical protein
MELEPSFMTCLVTGLTYDAVLWIACGKTPQCRANDHGKAITAALADTVFAARTGVGNRVAA